MAKYRRILLTLIILLGGATLYVLDPARHVFMPKCIFRTLTGWNCPGCGLQRAAHALLHGRFGEALQYNYFLFAALPYLLAVMYMEWIAKGERRQQLRRVLYHRHVLYTYIALYLLWWIVRNILGV